MSVKEAAADAPARLVLASAQCVAPMRTVHNVLEAKGALGMLDDPLLAVATSEIVSGALLCAAVMTWSLQ
jgi:hypothetical protein